MAQAYKICPICETRNHRNASLCTTCGATLTSVKTVATPSNGNNSKVPANYNYHYGETDLSEGNLHWKGSTYILSGMLVFSILACIGGVLIAGTNLFAAVPQPDTASFTAPTVTPFNSQIVITNTPRPTLVLATVTPAPPTPSPTATPTLTPTQGPCIQEVQPNDDLYAILARCGHRHYDVMLDVVVELNQLEDPSRIQIGQKIEVPWPTETPDPNAVATAEVTSETGALDSANSVSMEPTRISALAPRPTATLPPGITWHEVQSDENILSIAYIYKANLKILSELNPEVTFSQCDFGNNAGGPNCIVELYIGQKIRVPELTATPTLSPTPSGSETPTPTATPTFNAPSPLNPADRAYFRNNEFVTLRWVTSGALSPEQVYLVSVQDQTTQITYEATTRELYFIMPEEWHNQDATRHDFEWTVSVIDSNNPDHPYYVTEPRLFTWQGQGKSQ